jgi:hypothetical protein
MAEKKAAPPPTLKPVPPSALRGLRNPPVPETKGPVRRAIEWIRGDAKPNKTG